MKQLVILSGKGGTGKTSLTAAFAHLAAEGDRPMRAVLVDADVDAANLELLIEPEVKKGTDFWAGQIAVIDQLNCAGCGTCQDVCRFGAVIEYVPATIPFEQNQDRYRVDPLACEGCAACVFQCPQDAIRLQPQMAGEWYQSHSLYGPLFHAALRPAQENSGRLVTLVKQNARLLALDDDIPLLLVDGPPGVGCPVISAVSGADLALIVTESSAAGVHDLQRVLKTTRHFGVKTIVCINKFDLHPKSAAQINACCAEQNIEVVGRIPFDTTVTEAMVQAQPVTVYQPGSQASHAMRSIWLRVMDHLQGTG
jgi:MinD superfamily P-loop ATPase